MVRHPCYVVGTGNSDQEAAVNINARVIRPGDEIEFVFDGITYAGMVTYTQRIATNMMFEMWTGSATSDFGLDVDDEVMLISDREKVYTDTPYTAPTVSKIEPPRPQLAPEDAIGFDAW